MIYEYKCPNCNTSMDRYVSVEQRNNQTCECGHKMQRIYSAKIGIFNNFAGCIEGKGDMFWKNAEKDRLKKRQVE